MVDTSVMSRSLQPAAKIGNSTVNRSYRSPLAETWEAPTGMGLRHRERNKASIRGSEAAGRPFSNGPRIRVGSGFAFGARNVGGAFLRGSFGRMSLRKLYRRHVVELACLNLKFRTDEPTASTLTL